MHFYWKSCGLQLPDVSVDIKALQSNLTILAQPKLSSSSSSSVLTKVLNHIQGQCSVYLFYSLI